MHHSFACRCVKCSLRMEILQLPQRALFGFTRHQTLVWMALFDHTNVDMVAQVSIIQICKWLRPIELKDVTQALGALVHHGFVVKMGAHHKTGTNCYQLVNAAKSYRG